MFENDAGGTHGTLFAACNHCVTGPGRRLLRRWLGRPLARVADISRRQDAVAALLGPAADAAREARKKLKGGLQAHDTCILSVDMPLNMAVPCNALMLGNSSTGIWAWLPP